ncbi:hypothetical protein SS1G_06118 [Sclerotinia sclerotiorum 1980 UF-70]|uniref:non-specific serine/threonine protein kinase n=1 Tax=Sclerotinia sclerotiorum (strain ATCC 18683 / 1980 / Ss-1) TaxID=665079 RepID=A7ELC1_SCLS1|nr:hypothetical protein SS1G_06118 [Sclerotinia sclerotiorum 1980 UF-70]EDO03637.1 hypothetical protein SS1G_06118 [Sclerotinia sclerotiorum 1980 UF-70]
MASVLKWARAATRRAPSLLLIFPTKGFELIDDALLLDEEEFEGFEKGLYYPVNIGDVFASKYQVVESLATAEHKHVSLKVYIRDVDPQEEFQIYQRLSTGNKYHPGYRHIRTALGIFTIPREGGDHACLVQNPMWESFKYTCYRLPGGCFTEKILKGTMQRLFAALDYLHTECQLVHTDIKPDNMMTDIEDNSILDAFIEAELECPSPRKLINSVTVYASRMFDVPKRSGDTALSDFGSAVRGDEKRNHGAGAQVYRAPEVMIKAAWSYPVDIWNVGVMIWDLFEGKHMFYGQDSDGEGYSTRAHLAEVIGMLGPPPLDFLERGVRVSEFFDKEGKWIAEMHIVEDLELEKTELRLQGRNKEVFLNFMRE